AQLVNTVTVSADNDTNSANNSATDKDNLTPQSDLSITKTDNGAAIVPGQDNIVVYTIVVSNSGPSTAVGQTVTDTLSNIPGFVSDTWSGNGKTNQPGNISDTIASLKPGAGNSATYTVTASIPPAASATRPVA